jgi:hypothetical protein
MKLLTVVPPPLPSPAPYPLPPHPLQHLGLRVLSLRNQVVLLESLAARPPAGLEPLLQVRPRTVLRVW